MISYRLKNALFRLIHPSFWIQNEKSCHIWDKCLNDILDSEPKVVAGSHTTKLGSLSLWTSNYPYCYGHQENGQKLLPLPLTRVRLKNYISIAIANDAISKAKE